MMLTCGKSAHRGGHLKVMTTKDLQTKYPSIYQTIYLEGYRATEKMLECPEEQQDKEKEVGVKAERARVKAVFEIGRKMPGHVALVERFMCRFRV